MHYNAREIWDGILRDKIIVETKGYNLILTKKE